ncbi:MAG TPA: ester cyclase [Ktedonobacteraceae bacterium]
MPAEENKALVRRFVSEILNKGNMALAPELVAEDYVELDPFPGQQPGRAGLVDTIAMVRTAFPDLHWTIEDLVAERQKVAGYGVWRGTHQGVFLGIPPTGKQVAVPCMVFDSFVDGKLKESRLMMNIMSLMQQLGVVSGTKK